MIATVMNNTKLPASKSPMLDIDTVATWFGVSQMTIRRLADSGKLIGYRIGGQYRFKQEDVDKYLEAARIAPKEVTPDEESEDANVK